MTRVRTVFITATVLALCLFARVSMLVAAEPAGAAKLPNSPAGQRAAAYLTAFNSGSDEALRAFFTENVAPASLQQRPVEARLAVARRFRQQVRSLVAHKVLTEDAARLAILAQGGNGDWLTMTFECEPNPPHKLLGIRIEESDSPEELAAAPKTNAELIPALDRWLAAATSADEFSGAVLVSRKGETLYQKAFGLASREYGVANTVDTRFNLGSINKIVTRVAIAQLVENGLLAPTDTLGKVLPNYQNQQAAAKVTVQQLLDMASGIGDFFGPRFDDTPKDRLRSIRDYLPLFASEALLFEPGSSERYSNGGYVVLGAIIEKVSGQDYYTYVRGHVFAPAGMTSSDSFEADAIVPNVASGYSRDEQPGGAPGPLRNNIYTRPARGSSAGGGYSTVSDLARFAQALRGGKLLSPESMQRFFPMLGSPQTGSLGFAGGAPGISADIEIENANETTIVVLTNLDPPCAERAARRIRTWLRRLAE
jgi:CubicO group peptidase (beta-lactamase class C family)